MRSYARIRNFLIISITVIFLLARNNLPRRSSFMKNDQNDLFRNVHVENSERKEFIVNMMRHAWKGYTVSGFGCNENLPVTGSCHSGVLGNNIKGVTIVDAIDTLYIMGLKDEYAQARQWIEKNFTCEVTGYISFFEFNIRIMGGLLSIYALTEDKVFLSKLADCAERLYTAGFVDTDSLPMTKVDLAAGNGFRDLDSLAQTGSFYMEFTYLSYILKDEKYHNKVKKALESVPSVFGESPPYLCYSNVYSAGAECDSFYEYLLKNNLQLGNNDSHLHKMFVDSADAIYNKLTMRNEEGLFLIEEVNKVQKYKMSSLACFAGAMYFLASETYPRFKVIGEDITSACYFSYDSTKTKIGPESFGITGKPLDSSYLLRPEVVESYFAGFRVTGENKYRDYAWEAALAIEKYAKVKYGYSGIKNVNQIPVVHDNVQQSYFLAETLKYLYLTFSHEIDLKDWVFNTEGHPFPVLRDV